MFNSGGRSRIQFPILEVAGLAMILIATVLLVLNLANFSGERQRMPPSLLMGGVPVGNLPRSQAQARVEEIYGSPITVFYREQEIRLSPAQVGLTVNSDAMLSKADEMRTEGTFWSGFWDFLWLRPESAYDVDLVVDYSADLLRAWLSDLAARYDRPPQPAQAELSTLSFKSGGQGYTLDHEESFLLLDGALRRPTNRTVQLAVNEISASGAELSTLKTLIVEYLMSQQFKGVSSTHIIDLQTGDELRLDVDLRGGGPSYVNCDIAYAGMSTMKIAIMAEFFRYLDGRPEAGTDNYKLLSETMVFSGDTSANFMLEVIGAGNGYTGAKNVTQMMQSLGMKNSFIVVPYQDKTPASEVFYLSPAYEAARNGTCVNTRPDYAMQTTPTDLAILLDMIYHCAESGGGLTAVYPGEIVQDECRMMVELMKENPDGIIMAGLPEDIQVAHKHGWGSVDTYSDAAIVYSPGGDYVLTSFLWADTTEWLRATVAFPIIRDISVMTFNYFNPDMVNTPRRDYNPDLGVEAP
ncbi:MAG: serine hydrolase [Anaerolineae bacterium]|nr:serine hydrolase [Anaerolineae bacterium]